jgi:Mce-associated membrane protein
VTSPPSGSADEPFFEPEKESAAVRSDTDTAIDPADTKTATDEVAEGDTPAPTEASDAEDVEDSGGTFSEESETDERSGDAEPVKARRRIRRSRALVYAVLPGMAVSLAITAGFFEWQDISARNSRIAAIESVAAAKDAAIGLLSYKPDSADKDLDSARDRLTGSFKEAYTQLTHDVVIPGAKQKHISSVATVPAAAPVSATRDHAVVVLFVNQTTVAGTDAPTDSESTVRVTLDKIDGRGLVSGFEPI